MDLGPNSHMNTYAFTYAEIVRERFLKRHQCKVILRKLHTVSSPRLYMRFSWYFTTFLGET